jgi:ribonuclease-3
MMDEYERVEQILGYQFKNRQILHTALTHSSFSHEAKHTFLAHNERLEFLGDQVFGILVSDYLYRHYPESEEGHLSHLRAHLVEAPACASYAQSLALAEFLKLGKGELRNQGKGRESLVADLFEALLGAIFFDGGFDAVYIFFEDKLKPLIEAHLLHPPLNFKAELQQLYQKEHKTHPVYKVLEQVGPEHSKIFTVGVYHKDELMALGKGQSKKQAEMQAAKIALQSWKPQGEL